MDKMKVTLSDRISVKADRWPWQGYGWFGTSKQLKAPLNARGARFGGGWRWCFGFRIGSFSKKSSMLLDLLFGTVRIKWDFRTKHEIISERF